MDFSADFYKRLFVTLDSNAVMMKVGREGQYFPIWCSEEFLHMIEGTQEEYFELESNGEMHTIHQDDKEEVAYLFKNQRTKSGTNHLDVRKKTVTGKWKWVKVRYAFLDDDGEKYAYCTYEDITELKESQAQTQTMYVELNKELNALADNSLAALRSNLTKGVVEEVRGTDLYDVDKVGAGIEELIKVRMDNMPIESERKKYLEVFDLERLKEKYYLGEGPASMVVFSRRQSGRQCFIKYSAAMRKDPITGDVIVLGVETECNTEMINDVLDNKILAQQYDMVTYLVSGYYGVAIGDSSNIKKGSIFPKNKNGIYMDYIREQVIPSIHGTEKDKAEILEALSLDTVSRKLEKEEPYTVHVECDIDGEYFTKRFMFFVVNREAEYYILLKSDITDVIKEQQERNEILADALDEAERANAAKTAFLSNMSHEIRTPMNAIIGLGEIALQEPELPDSTREHLEKIGGSAKHLLGLINDILDMSRIESGRMTIRKEEFAFSQIMEQVNTMIGGQCRDKGLNYECRIKNRIDDYFIGDDTKLKQVIINILGNSVKFTPEGGTVTLTMQDTGIGMDKSYLPKIFNAFSQEHEGRSNKYGSTGLGMAITKNIVEMMNGSIHVDSEKGKGTTFTVIVTLKSSDREYGMGEEIEMKHLNVLVIDDDPVDCEHARIALEEIGITPDICSSGNEAIEHIEIRAARHEAYDLILVDLRMPDKDGVVVTRDIRKIAGSESAVIVLTAYNWEDIEKEAKAAGVDHFMAKPLFSVNVLSAYKTACENRKVSQENMVLADLTGRRVLLAEDMEINAQIMKMLLSTKSIEADHAENGQVAVDKFSASEVGYYDAVLRGSDGCSYAGDGWPLCDGGNQRT